MKEIFFFFLFLFLKSSRVAPSHRVLYRHTHGSHIHVQCPWNWRSKYEYRIVRKLLWCVCPFPLFQSLHSHFLFFFKNDSKKNGKKPLFLLLLFSSSLRLSRPKDINWLPCSFLIGKLFSFKRLSWPGVTGHFLSLSLSSFCST